LGGTGITGNYPFEDMRLNNDNIVEFVSLVIGSQEDAKVRTLRTDRILSGYGHMMNLGLARAYGTADDKGNPTGFLLGMHSVEPLNGERMAFEYLFMVSPGSGDTARKLLAEFEAGAREDGCVKIVVGCHKEFKPKVLERWYRRLGFSWVTSSFERTL